MSEKAISISLAKIDYDFDEPYIKIIADCPSGYRFTNMTITVQMPNGNKWIEKDFDASKLIAGKDDVVLNIPVSVLEGVEGPAMYYIKLVAKLIKGEEPENPCEELPAVIETDIYLSDVHGVYRCLLDGLLHADPCEGVSNEVIKNYLILYGHQAALADGDLKNAKELYKLLHKCFSKCGNIERTSKCNCNAGCK